MRFIAFFAVLFLLDSLLGSILETAFLSTQGGDSSGRINSILQQRNEIVIFGSSRARCHYVSRTIESKLGVSAYNAGINGQGIIVQYAVEHMLLQRYRPKLIVLDLVPSDLFQMDYERLSILLPYYRDPEVLEIVSGRSRNEKIKLLSRIYPFNSLVLQILNSLYRSERDDIVSKGYSGVYGSLIDAFEMRTKMNFGKKQKLNDSEDTRFFQQAKEQALRKFLHLAKERKIKVIACLSPFWEKGELNPYKNSSMLNKYSGILSDYHVPLITITQSSHEIFKDKKFFYDPRHLNERGAEIFSQIFADQLKKFM